MMQANACKQSTNGNTNVCLILHCGFVIEISKIKSQGPGNVAQLINCLPSIQDIPNSILSNIQHQACWQTHEISELPQWRQ